ncbi:MAG: AdoMet-dependent heme synthase [Thermodesulfobacteriota bacterium]|nr:AdoMet-dependent heme synthase [Thermodesulfobacteriota bacterium]
MKASLKDRLLPSTLRMVAWEVTRSCNLACAHCRASAVCGPYEGELDTAACRRLIDEIAAFSHPVIILTGGEPLLRPDIWEIAAYGSGKGLRMVMATNGTLVTEDIAKKMLAAGIRRVSVSLDDPDAVSHDLFRRVPGAFAGTMCGIEAMRRAGMEFQINTTITKDNLAHIEDIHDLALKSGAAALHIFLLVPTGRARELAEQEISAEQYERTLEWLYERSLACPIQLKATCAPHYHRILQQHCGEASGKEAGKRAGHPPPAMARGCMGGVSFCFISHTGQVQPCGYLEVDCGQVKEKGFQGIWGQSAVFQDLRNPSLYKGKCGECKFMSVCGGCRARAYEKTGDYLAEEPYCLYQPQGRHKDEKQGT